MLDPFLAMILIERQLAATDWVEIAPPPGCDLVHLLDYRRKLMSILRLKAWHRLADLPSPRTGPQTSGPVRRPARPRDKAAPAPQQFPR